MKLQRIYTSVVKRLGCHYMYWRGNWGASGNMIWATKQCQCFVLDFVAIWFWVCAGKVWVGGYPKHQFWLIRQNHTFIQRFALGEGQLFLSLPSQISHTLNFMTFWQKSLNATLATTSFGNGNTPWRRPWENSSLTLRAWESSLFEPRENSPTLGVYSW